MRSDKQHRVTGSLIVVERKTGPVYFLKARDRDGRQIKRKLGQRIEPFDFHGQKAVDWVADTRLFAHSVLFKASPLGLMGLPTGHRRCAAAAPKITAPSLLARRRTRQGLQQLVEGFIELHDTVILELLCHLVDVDSQFL